MSSIRRDTLNALIGHTGFVGNILKKQTNFEQLYNTSNIDEIEYNGFDTVVCAAAPAQKWVANKNPQVDRANIEKLTEHLGKLSASKFILVSTVDVFDDAFDVDEDEAPNPSPENAYGTNRLFLEKYVKEKFTQSLIVRLPGLVGPGLKKNVLFDFKYQNNVHLIDSRAIFQFYPMINIWRDIVTALEAQLDLIHLTSEPIDVKTVAQEGFGIDFNNHIQSKPANYNFKTKYSNLYSMNGAYQYERNDVIHAIKSYSQYP